jgi:hypothetical protein
MLIHSAVITGSVQFNNTDVSGITSVAGFASTGSNQFNGNQSISGSITSNGTITAQTLVVQTVTSSVEFVTGSTKNGSIAANTHQFTGSVLMTGSLSVTTTGTELQVNASGVNIGNALTDNHIISGSVRINPDGLFVSSSGNIGIGTSSPSAQLHIYGKASNTFTDGLKITRSEQANQYLVLNYEGGIINLVAVDSQFQGPQFRFMTSIDGSNATERVRFTKDGNVGIGTTSPDNLLSVRGNLDLGVVSYSNPIIPQYGSITFPRGQVLFSNTNNQNQLYLASNAYNNASGVFAYRSGSLPALSFGLDNGTFSFLTAGNGTADTAISWTTMMSIANGGNVTMGGTGSTKLQSGTTAQRPTAAAGQIRYNTSLGEMEVNNGSNWGSLQTKVMLGSSPSNAAESANDIKTYYPNATNGFYWIKQTGNTAVSAYCVFKDATGADIAGGPWTVPIISNDSNANFSSNGPAALATFLSKCQAIGINTPGRGMESSRTTTEVYGAWLAVKRAIWEAYTPFVTNGNTVGGAVLRMPLMNINGEGGTSAHRLVYNTSLSTHLPPNESGDACGAGQLFCGWWSATDVTSWRTNNNDIPGPEDWGPTDTNNTSYNGAGVNSTLTVCVYK